MQSGWTATKASGAALIVGALGMLVTYLLRPGVLIDSGGGSNRFADGLRAMSQNAELTHYTSTIGFIVFILMVCGLLQIWPLLGNRGTDAVARWGLVFLLVTGVAATVAYGLAHIATHTVVHASDAGVPQQQANFVAAPIEGAKVGIRLISSTTFGLGALLLALGLAPRLPAGGARTTAYVAAAVGLVAAAIAIIRGHVHDVDVSAIQIAVVVLIDLWFVLLGVSLFRGDGEAWADEGG